MQEIYNNLDVVKNVTTQTTVSGTDIVGAEIDTQGMHALMVVLHCGVTGGTPSGTVKIDLKLEKAPDDGTGSAGSFVDAVTDDMLGDVIPASGIIYTIDAAAEDDIVVKFGVRVQNAAYRFWRPTIVVTGNPLFPVAMSAIKGRLEHMPQGGI